MKNRNLNELFATPIGGNMKKIDILGFSSIYTNDKLKLSYVEALSKSSLINNSELKKIEKLVKDEKIVPCFMSKNILVHIYRKYKWWKNEDKHLMGFFDNISKKVIMLIDNETNIFNYVNNNQLAKITKHECVHMLSNNNSSYFIKTFYSPISSFYRFYFMEYFLVPRDKYKNINEKKFKDFINFLYKEVELGAKTDNITLKKYYDYLNDIFKDLSYEKEYFISSLRKLIITIKMFFVDANSFIKNYDYYSQQTNVIYNVYRDLFKLPNLDTMAIQELFLPSEIICVLSEKNKMSIFKYL